MYNSDIEKLTIDGSTRNSRIIDSYFANNSVLTYGSENKPLDYKKEYFNELKHFAYGYPDWKWDYHHAGFDIVANRILEVVNSYYAEVHTRFDELIELMDENTIDTPITSNSRRSDNFDGVTDAGVCYWVTGHSMGAGVANLVAASLISSEAIPEISELEGTSDNVYCYTFAAPNTFYKTDNRYIRDSHAIPGKNVTGDYREPKGVKYRCNDRLDGHIRMVRELLKGNPVISITGSGPFGGGHFIVIAGVRVEDMDLLLGKNEIVKEDIDKLKKRTTPITDTELVTKINGLNYEDLAGLRIRVLDPRFRHEYHPINNKKSTMSEDWSIETFIYNGAGKARKFWIYTTNNKYVNLGTKTVVNTQTNESIIVNKTQLDLFNYNEEKYPNNYEEYFKPQKAGDSDEFCNVTKNDEREISYFGKKRQDWKYHSFPGLVSH